MQKLLKDLVLNVLESVLHHYQEKLSVKKREYLSRLDLKIKR